jgi:hypothetical protein
MSNTKTVTQIYSVGDAIINLEVQGVDQDRFSSLVRNQHCVFKMSVLEWDLGSQVARIRLEPDNGTREVGQ